MSKKRSKQNGSSEGETALPQSEVTNSVAESVVTPSISSRDEILAKIAELKAMLPPGQKGPKPIELKFPSGEFTVGEVARDSGVCYITALTKVKEMASFGKLVKLPHCRNEGRGTGRPKWLFKLPE